METPLLFFFVCLTLQLTGFIQGIEGSETPSTRPLPPLGRAMKAEFPTDEKFVQLNHGAYGTYPRDVYEALYRFQTRIESNPERWMRLDLRTETDNVYTQLGKYMNADPADLVVVPNTTGGVNAVFRSLIFNENDKILHFSTVYPNMRSIVQFIVDTNVEKNVSKVEFEVKYPITNANLVTNFTAFLEENTQIRIALIDHISPFPGVINPLEQFIPLLKNKNISIVIDGAHTLGQIPVDMKALDVDFYVASCYKWLFAVRGTSIMYVKKEHQHLIHPAQIGRNYNKNGLYQREFAWTGALDFSPFMTVPAAIAFRAKIGEEKLNEYTRNLALEGGALVRDRLKTTILQEDDQVGNMIDVELPIENVNDTRAGNSSFWDPSLLEHNLFVTVHKHNDRIWARLSAQIYNDISDFEYAAYVLQILTNELNGLPPPPATTPSDGGVTSNVLAQPISILSIMIFAWQKLII